MVRFLKLLLFLIVVGLSSMIGYAIFGDLEPNRVEVNKPVDLDGN